MEAQEGSQESQESYVIHRGDTLYGISRRFDVKLKDLVRVNHIRNSNLIRPGQILILPKSRKAHPILLPSPKLQPLAQEELMEAGPILMTEEETSTLQPPREVSDGKEDDIIETGFRRGFEKDFFGAGFSWWFASLDAQAKASLEDVIGTEIDLIDDLGIDDSVGIPVFNVWISPLSWLKVQGEYMNLDVDGARSIDESITFEGRTFRISDTVGSRLDVDRFSAWVELNPFRGSWGYAGGSIGLEYIRLDGELSSDLIGTASATLEGGTPTLGGQFAVALPYHLQLHGRLRGMTLELGGFEVDVVDSQGGLAYTGLNHFQLSADYRYLFLDVSEEDHQGDLTIQGPVLSASVKF